MSPTTNPPDSDVAAGAALWQDPTSDDLDSLPSEWLLQSFAHARDLLSQIDCGPAISMAIIKTQALLEADSASICLVDSGGSPVQHVLAAGQSAATAVTEPTDEWLPYQRLDECEAIHRHGACPSCRLLPSVKWCASAPLYVGGRQIGMLCAMRKPSQPPFSRRQLRMLQTLTGWTSVAIGNARKLALLRETQRSERERIAAHLHDNAAQSLSIIGLMVDQIETSLGGALPDNAVQQLHTVKDMSQQLMAQVRAAFGELRQPEQPPGDIVSALAGCINTFNQISPLPVQFNIAGDCTLPDGMTVQAVQIVNEALHNIIRHAHASNIQLKLVRDTQSVRIVVQDNGVGFDLKSAATEQHHLGTTLMRERASRSGGSLTINSKPGHGTQVILTYPAAALA